MVSESLTTFQPRPPAAEFYGDDDEEEYDLVESVTSLSDSTTPSTVAQSAAELALYEPQPVTTGDYKAPPAYHSIAVLTADQIQAYAWRSLKNLNPNDIGMGRTFRVYVDGAFAGLNVG